MPNSMRSNFTVLIALAGFLFFTPLAYAQGENHEEIQHEQAHHEDADHTEGHGEASGEKDIKGVIKETIEHHLADSYEFHITDGVGFPLPVISGRWRSKSIPVFSISSRRRCNSKWCAL